MRAISLKWRNTNQFFFTEASIIGDINSKLFLSAILLKIFVHSKQANLACFILGITCKLSNRMKILNPDELRNRPYG